MTGAEMKSWRTKMRWTQAKFAAEIGLGERVIVRYEASPEIPLIVDLAIQGWKRRNKVRN